MKARLLTAILLVASARHSLAQKAEMLLPETGANIAFSFAPSPNAAHSFRALTITSNSKPTTFALKYSAIRIPNDPDARRRDGVWVDIDGLKLDPSRFFLHGQYTVDGHPHTLIFFLGQAGIGAAPLFVIGFNQDGTPFKILERAEFDVTSLQSNEGGVLIIGKTSLSQVMTGDGGNGSKQPYATTYDPFSVFQVHPSGPAAYSLEASRTYNREHYVWAGQRVREDYAVLYNVPGHRKPFGEPASKVSELLATAGAK